MKKNVKIAAALLISVALGFGFTTKPKVQDQYVIDVGHTSIQFDVERFLVGEVSGRFNDFVADLSMEGEDYTSLKVSASIKTKSIDSNNDTRDGHLKGKMWLDVENHPEILFTSSQVVKKSKSYMMKGELSIKGIKKEIEFPIEILGPFTDPTKKSTIGIKADFVIDRFDYGMNFNKEMDSGGLFIGKDVKIKIRALAHRK